MTGWLIALANLLHNSLDIKRGKVSVRMFLEETDCLWLGRNFNPANFEQGQPDHLRQLIQHNALRATWHFRRNRLEIASHTRRFC
jgi:hypothetical protein